MEQKNKEEAFLSALENKKIPILTLDHKWHLLFGQTDTSVVILKLEEELNSLLKRQGKLNSETKEILKIKKRLMDEIIPLVDEFEQTKKKSVEKKIETNKRLINECNEKLDDYKDELMELPIQIEDVNYKLMLATMDICYEKLKENEAEVDVISKWISEMRVELKKKVVRKQEKEQENQNLYSYMHAIFGADVIDLFDMHYKSGTENAQKKK